MLFNESLIPRNIAPRRRRGLFKLAIMFASATLVSGCSEGITDYSSEKVAPPSENGSDYEKVLRECQEYTTLMFLDILDQGQIDADAQSIFDTYFELPHSHFKTDTLEMIEGEEGHQLATETISDCMDDNGLFLDLGRTQIVGPSLYHADFDQRLPDEQRMIHGISMLSIDLEPGDRIPKHSQTFSTNYVAHDYHEW